MVERYSRDAHRVNVTGQLKPGMTAIDVLRARLSRQARTGAPKIRAMEIIDELEPVKRGSIRAPWDTSRGAAIYGHRDARSAPQ